MTSQMQALIAPFAGEELLRLLRVRAVAFHRASDRREQTHVLDVDALLGLIASGAVAPKKLRITRQEQAVPPPLYYENGAPSIARIARLLDSGASVIAQGIDASVPALAALCAELRAATGEEIGMGAILTAGDGGALDFHFDRSDIVIRHLAGAKRWRMFAPTVPNPIREMPLGPPPSDAAPVLDEILRPGDLLFVPAGYWHRCENGPGRSLHVGIHFTPPTPWHAFRALLERAMANEDFRLPLTRHADAGARAAQEARIKQVLIGEIERTPLAALREPPGED